MQNPNRNRESYWRGYKAGYARGQRSATRLMTENLRKISVLVYLLCVGSDTQYELLRSLVMFGNFAIPNQRRVKLKINGVAIPCFSSINVVRDQIRDNDLDFVMGEKIYKGTGVDDWGNLNMMQETDDMEFKGVHVPMKDICTRFMGWVRGTIDTEVITFDVPTIQMLAWSDGARVKRGTVFGRVRFLDPSKMVIPKVASKMFYWFGYLGKERDMQFMSKIRGMDIEYLEQKLWWKDNFCFRAQFKFISGDNLMLWSEMKITKPFTCALCPKSKQQEDWMSYKTDSREYVERTLEFQVININDYGIKGVPALLKCNLHYFDANNVMCVVPIMHDLKASLDHGLTICNHFARIHFEGHFIPKSMIVANEEITARTRAILGGSGIVWNRHIRTIYAYFGSIYREVLNHVPMLYSLGICGTLVSYLCYQKKIKVSQELHWARLVVFTVLYESVLLYFSKGVAHLGKIPNCASTYDHGIMAHVSEQYWNTRILPIYLSEEEGEASIKAKKSVRTNNSHYDTLVKGLLKEQHAELAQKYLRTSLTSAYRLGLQQISKLPVRDIPNVKIWSCCWQMNDPFTFRNMFLDLRERVGDTAILQDNGDSIMIYLHNGAQENPGRTAHFCICEKHTDGTPLDSHVFDIEDQY